MITGLVCALLLWVLIEDLWRFRVRNGVVIGLVACFPLDCLLHGRTAPVMPHLVLAAVSFGVLAVAVRLRAVGGGDAKLLTAAMLWVGPEASVIFALLLAVATGLYALGARFGRLPAQRRDGRLAIPFGPGVAAAWIATIGLTRWMP